MTIGRRAFIAGLFACPVCAAVAAEGPHWTYEGPAGADRWGDVDPAFKACSAGTQQSPIDLKGPVNAAVDHLKFDWQPEPFALVNNGHTLQANAKPGGTLMLGKDKFSLLQFHFHGPSEHALNGKRTAMEVHFVHSQPSGRLAVVGVMMKAGQKHPGFAALMASAPKAEGEGELAKALDPATFLPGRRTFFRYEGSLTTPPCSEVVDWNVFETPIEVAQADIDAFHAIFPMNARPLQTVNRRFLLKGA